MSRIDTGTVRKAKALPNVYTVLALIATIALGVGVGCVWYYATQMTGQTNPFFVVQ